jgi:branched-chain amino acid transport system permease protein
VYGILHVPNFAHGAFYMAGAFAGFYLMTAFGPELLARHGGGRGGGRGDGDAGRAAGVPPAAQRAGLHDMIAAIGILLFLEAGAQALFGADFHRMPTPYGQIVESSGSPRRAAAADHRGAFGLMVLLHLFLTTRCWARPSSRWRRTATARRWWASTPTRVTLLVFAISGALAAVAAVLYAPINLVYPAMGNLVITKAFVIIILGGMGSVPGAIVGGLIIGFAESFGAFYFSTDYKDIIAFVLLVVILSFRPQGLFTPKGAR